MAAYRLIQEALTNALKHAGAATTKVTIRHRPDGVAIEVSDAGDAPVPMTARLDSGGQGLLGMRERIGLYGGELEVGPRGRGRVRGARAAAGRARGGGRMSVRVLLVDDQALIRAGFRMILDAEPDIEVVGESANGAQAVDSAKRLKPHVALMDIRMPEMDGIEATRRIVSLAENGADPVRVLMLTTFDLDEYVYDALRAGASGFLLKDVPADQLVAGIRLVAAGEALLAPSVTRRLIAEFSRTRGERSRGAGGGRRADPARARGAEADRPRALQRRDRRGACRLAHHGQDPRRAGAVEARPARPRPGRRRGLRIGTRQSRPRRLAPPPRGLPPPASSVRPDEAQIVRCDEPEIARESDDAEALSGEHLRRH